MFLQTFSPSPVLIELGPITVHWYGLFFALGLVAAYLVAQKIWKRTGRQIDNLNELFFLATVSAIVCARLADVFLFEWFYFKNNLWDIYKIWQGGLAWQGGIVGVLLVVVWYVRKHNDKLLDILDILAPAAAIGQAVGRWGNYFNQEIFGLPTNLLWGIFISPANRPEEYLDYQFFHPIFLYESIGLAVLAWLLWVVYKRKRWAGQIVISYLFVTSLLRLALEYIRVDEQTLFWGLRSGVWIASILIFVSLFILVKVRKYYKA